MKFYDEPKYMLATKAYYQGEDVSKDEEDFCQIRAEIGGDLIGRWCFDFGPNGVLFPAETTREPTEEELRDFLCAPPRR